MAKNQGIFRLLEESIEIFEREPEVFSGCQLGSAKIRGVLKNVVVVNGIVAVVISEHFHHDLSAFYAATWAQKPLGAERIVELYEKWIKGLDEVEVQHLAASRSDFLGIAAGGTTGKTPSAPPSASPPPPPTNPNLYPGGTRPTGTATAPGHLPFHDLGTGTDRFYRFEAWPTSRRVIVGGPSTAFVAASRRALNPGEIEQGTFASPESELSVLPTGFAAVARNALPSFFPAVFRYELEPVLGSPFLCGAVVPMFGQSGGGVEVMFSDPQTRNRRAIPPATIVAPY